MNEFWKEDLHLEDERVLLRPLRSKDFEHLLPFSEKEPELWEYSLQPGAGKENLLRYITHATLGRESGRVYPFIIYDKMLDAYAGSTRFYDIQPNCNASLIGYTFLGKKFQGTGLNRHCKFLMLSYAFDELELDRIEFRADVNNARSIASMKGIGATVEGVLRSHCMAPNGRRDSIVLSILKDEWERNVSQDLADKL